VSREGKKQFRCGTALRVSESSGSVDRCVVADTAFSSDEVIGYDPNHGGRRVGLTPACGRPLIERLLKQSTSSAARSNVPATRD